MTDPVMERVLSQKRIKGKKKLHLVLECGHVTEVEIGPHRKRVPKIKEAVCEQCTRIRDMVLR